MISLFIFKSNIRGMNYGLGTYLTQLTSSLVKYPMLKMYHVDYSSKKFKEFTILRSNEGVLNIYVPVPKILHNDERSKTKHSAHVLDLLAEIIHKAENVIFQVNYPSALPLIREIKKRYSFPVLSVIHSANWQFLSVGNKNKFIDAWQNKDEYDFNTFKELIEEKELYELADKIVSVTMYMKKFVSDYYKIEEDKISVIPNGIDISDTRILTRIEKIKLKKQLGFKANEKIILFTGRLDYGKGLHFLLQAFNIIFEKSENVRLVIVGEDSGTESISQFLSYCKDSWSKVTFTGFLKHENVVKFYQVADVGVMPSIYDHCPYVVLEMIAHNIPLIMSNIEGLNEILTENQAVYLDPLYDDNGNISFNIPDMAEAIISLLNDEKLTSQITKDYQDLIRNKFSSDKMSSEMYHVLRLLSMFRPCTK